MVTFIMCSKPSFYLNNNGIKLWSKLCTQAGICIMAQAKYISMDFFSDFIANPGYLNYY